MNDAAMALEVRRLAELIAALADDVRHMERRRLAADDRRVGAVLLRLAHELVGDARFTAPELFARALNDRTAAGRALCEVLVDYGSVRSIGRLLARLESVVLSGCRLVPAGAAREGRAWRLQRVSDD